MAIKIKIGRAEMARRVEALDRDLERLRCLRVERRFSTQDMTRLTGWSQENLIYLEKRGLIPRARRVGGLVGNPGRKARGARKVKDMRGRVRRWSEEQARTIIAVRKSRGEAKTSGGWK